MSVLGMMSASAGNSAVVSHPELLSVSSTADAGSGTLRAALERAQEINGPVRIVFGDDEGLFRTPQVIQLNSPLPEIIGQVSILGQIDRLRWTPYGATISGSGEHRIFQVAAGARLHLNGITLADGRGLQGGAILNHGHLIVEGVTLLNNHAERDGGAIANLGGEVFFINSTVADGTGSHGGAIANLEGYLTVTQATLFRNAAWIGGAIYSTGPLALANSILWSDEVGQCVNTGELIRSRSNLFIDDGRGCGQPLLQIDPKLGRFDYFNGPTPLFSLEEDSPALNLGDRDSAVDHRGQPLAWDQRGQGQRRFSGGFSDLGAFERQRQQPAEYVVDTIEDTGLRGCSANAPGSCPLPAAIELALAGRQTAPIRFCPEIFAEPQILHLTRLPQDASRKLVFDGVGSSGVTILAPRSDLPWEGINGVRLELSDLATAQRD